MKEAKGEWKICVTEEYTISIGVDQIFLEKSKKIRMFRKMFRGEKIKPIKHFFTLIFLKKKNCFDLKKYWIMKLYFILYVYL